MGRGWWRGAVLKKARERRKLTQAALAKKVGVHQVTIARLETGMADSYTSPSFAGGRIFIRNLEQVAAIRISAADRP